MTGHDPDFHAVTGAPGSNVEGARRILQRSVAYVTAGKPDPRLLLVTATSSSAPDSLDSRVGLADAGLSFDVAHAADAGDGVLDVRTVSLAAYDAVIVASDHGGWLGQGEVDALTARAEELATFVAAGGGLLTLGESRVDGAYGFLPFLVSQVPVNEPATRLAVTAFGQQLGLADGDVNG